MQIFYFIDEVDVATLLLIIDSYYLNGKPDLEMRTKSVSHLRFT